MEKSFEIIVDIFTVSLLVCNNLAPVVAKDKKANKSIILPLEKPLN